MSAPQGPATEADFEQTKGRVTVSRHRKEWLREWNDTLGMKPQRFYEVFAGDLPGEPHVFIELQGYGHAELSVGSSVGGKRFLSVDQNLSRHHGTFHLEEIRVEGEGDRRGGTGKIYFANIVGLCRELGIKRIEMRAGREDGPYFWSRRGAYVEPHLVDRFKESVRENLAAISDELAPERIAAINRILDEHGGDVNAALARLPDIYDDEPLAARLLYGTNPRVFFDLSDPGQQADIEKGLHDIEALRQRNRETAPVQAPAGGAAPGGPALP